MTATTGALFQTSLAFASPCSAAVGVPQEPEPEPLFGFLPRFLCAPSVSRPLPPPRAAQRIRGWGFLTLLSAGPAPAVISVYAALRDPPQPSFLFTPLCGTRPRISGWELSFLSDHTFCRGGSFFFFGVVLIELLTIKINHNAFTLIYPLNKGRRAVYKTRTYRDN